MKFPKKLNFLGLLAALVFINSPQVSGQSNYSEGYNDLMLFVAIISLVVGIFVLGLWIYFIYKFREGTDVDRTPMSHTFSRKLELAWTAIATGIVVLLMAVSYPILIEIDATLADGKADEVIIVQGQGGSWAWVFFEEDGTPITNGSDPSTFMTETDSFGFQVRTSILNLKTDVIYKFILMNVGDNIHSFYVPKLHIKQDVIPGVNNTIIVTILEPGEYQILCAEYCGTGHSGMRGIIKVTT
ncbi:MAG: cytochrome c oxidase subunit II [Candidatus Heimdallarchaeota archaeon]|nr:cytochrome c oxidase subunit II [Candidatus Heimdallarchaeota archaeon]